VSRLGVQREPRRYKPTRPPAGLHIVSIAHLSPVKRIELLLQGFALAVSKGLDAYWTHIGGGRQLAQLRRTTKRLGVTERTRLLGHLGSGDHGVRPHLRSNWYDLSVNVSSSEGLPVALQETLSFGIPAMATAVGGNTELVRLSGGIELPAHPCAEEVADALCRFASIAPEAREAMREAARAAQLRYFDAELNSQHLIAWLDELGSS
jgi:glycosyltransferase involved in cell wall biosynthesis